MKRNPQLSILILILLLFGAIMLTACSDLNSKSFNLQENCIRIHIRANSNSAEDQEVKLKVRDAVTNYLSSILANCKTKAEAFDLLSKNKARLVKIADSALKQSNFEYKTSIRLSNEYFPDRVYDGYEFPAGNYDALILELGSGKGDNWWCVAFPPLCFVPGGETGEKIEYKSWVKEMLNKLFG